MASRNPDLYRWKRWSKESPASTPHLNTSKKKSHGSATDDIQGWIKKVEKASDQAAALTFGPGHSHNGDYSAANRYRGAAATLEAVHDHDEAHSEAQDLLNQWMAQKCGLDDDGEDDMKYFEDDDIQDYVASKEAERSDLRSQWNNMLAENDPVAMDPYSQVTSEELFHEIETRDDSIAVQSILDGLLKKDIVKTKFKKDLGLEGETKKRDPRTTMAARQQKVKENREKRQQTRESKLRQQQQHKDTQSQAHQLVMKEERTREMQRQREEALVQQEMARLRKDMQGQRLQEEAVRQREREREAKQMEEQRKEEAKRRQEELQKRLEADSLIEEEKREMRKRLEELRAVKAAQDLKCLQRHFHAWYQMVMTKRLALGKARAVSDWRTLLRAWNAWRAYVRASQADRETREIEQSFKDVHRKNQMALVHNRKRILKKYLLDWKLWLQNEHLSRDLEQQQSKTKSKMAAFLEAAASGKLWTNREEEEEACRDKSGRKETSDRPDSVAQKVDDIFGVQSRPTGNIASGASTARSDTSSYSGSPRSKGHHNTAGPSKPKHAWQVTRKHVNLPIEEMLTVGQDDGEQLLNRNQNNAVSDKESETGVNSSSSGKRNINYKTNSFEHRYAAQQRVLHEQQYQLREQRRLIEDLQTAQQQQLLKMQLGGAAKDATLETPDVPDSLLSTERTQPEVDTPSSTARSDHSDSSSVSDQSKHKQTTRPQLLKGMKEREEARLKMKAEREERHRKREQEKLAEIKAKEEKQREEEEAEKMAKIEKRREEKRLAKQRELEKQERLERLNEQTLRADEHYRRSLLEKKGLNPWLRLVKTARQNMQVAEDHHSTVLLRKCMLPWRQHTEEVMQEKVAMATQQYEFILIQGAMNSWKRFGHRQSLQLQKARRHYIHNLKMRVLQAWQEHITTEKLRMWKNEEVADEHSEIRILKTAFIAWRQYPKMLKAERLREKRLEDIRKKVASILPDFGVS